LKEKEVLNPMHALPISHTPPKFKYDETKSKIFNTYPDGTPLPTGWTREEQGDEVWYHHKDGELQWDAPSKGTSV
jgi:hypothetical protein